MQNRGSAPFSGLTKKTTMSSTKSEADTRVPVIEISQIQTHLPYFQSVPAGFPSPANDYVEEQLNLDKYLIKNPAATFFVRVSGDSMTGAGIYPEDILIVDRSLQAKSNDVVIALLEGEFTVKRLVYEHGFYWLKPEHASFKPIQVLPESDFQVWGVVTNVIHKPYVL